MGKEINILPQHEEISKSLYDELRSKGLHVSTEIKIVELMLFHLRSDAQNQIKNHESQIEALKKMI